MKDKPVTKKKSSFGKDHGKAKKPPAGGGTPKILADDEPAPPDPDPGGPGTTGDPGPGSGPDQSGNGGGH